MFLKFYNLREQPFGVTPDPRFLYLSQTHREALASLVYGVEQERGFLAMIAPPGMGKTTLLFQLLERLRNSARTAFLFNTQCDSRQLLSFLLTDLGVDLQQSDPVKLHEQLHALLLRTAHEGRRCVFIIDEAQNLDSAVLETVRLLSNFETPRSKLLQIVISGQPNLSERLAEPGLAQFRQRISIMTRLKPLSAKDTARYIHHRLRVAGYEGESLFSQEGLERVAALGNGIPRVINNLCFNALSLGYVMGRREIDGALIEEAVADLHPHMLLPPDLAQESADAGSEMEEGIASIPPFLGGPAEGRRRNSAIAFVPPRFIPLHANPTVAATTAISPEPSDEVGEPARETSVLESDGPRQPGWIARVVSQPWFGHLGLTLRRNLSRIQDELAKRVGERMRRAGPRVQTGKAMRTTIYLSLALAGTLVLLRQGESQGVAAVPVQAAPPAAASLPQAKQLKGSPQFDVPPRGKQRSQYVGHVGEQSASSLPEGLIVIVKEAGSEKDLRQLSLLNSAEARSNHDEVPAVPSFVLPEHYAEREQQVLRWIVSAPPAMPSLAKPPVAPAPAGGTQK